MVDKHSLGVDVSSYQSTDISGYKRLDAKFCVVKLTQGTGYVNPNAKGQITSAKANHVLPMGYFYATFSSNSYAARREARFCVKYAKAYGLPKGSYLAVDWETGSGNATNGYTSSNTSAVIAAMLEIKRAGYQPLLYSGAALMTSAVSSYQVCKKFGACLWVAQYPTMSGVSSPYWDWKPKINGMAIWQFTPNWYGTNVDANVALIRLDKKATSNGGDDFEMALHPVVRYDKQGVAVVRNKHFAYVYDSSDLKHAVGKRKRGESFITYGAKGGAVKVGKNQWFDGRAVVYFVNPIASNPAKAGVCKVIKGTHTFKHADSSSKKGKWLPAGTKLKFDKRNGKWLHTDKGWVTGLRAYVVL